MKVHKWKDLRRRRFTPDQLAEMDRQIEEEKMTEFDKAKIMVEALKVVLQQVNMEIAYWNERRSGIAVGAWTCTQGCILDKLLTVEAYLKAQDAVSIKSSEAFGEVTAIIEEPKT